MILNLSDFKMSKRVQFTSKFATTKTLRNLHTLFHYSRQMDIARKTSTKYIDLPNHGFPATKQEKGWQQLMRPIAKLVLLKKSDFWLQLPKNSDFWLQLQQRWQHIVPSFSPTKMGKCFLSEENSFKLDT
jgi:hypothetical protein